MKAALHFLKSIAHKSSHKSLVTAHSTLMRRGFDHALKSVISHFDILSAEEFKYSVDKLLPL